MRKTFYDLLDEIEFDVLEEYKRLIELFEVETLFYNSSSYTLKEYIDNEVFRNLPLRKSFINIDDMRTTLGFAKTGINIDELFLFCEMLLGIMNGYNEYPKIFANQCIIIRGNVNSILEKTNHKLIKDIKNQNRIIIVENNKSATLAAEIVSDKTVSFEILEYNHYALKGNLSKKKQILVSIGAYLEPILNTKTLSNSGYKKLETNAGFLLNNFHLRHNNKEGTKAQDYIISIDDKTLEEWYDKTYDVLLQAIITSENLKVEREIDSLKQTYTWRN